MMYSTPDKDKQVSAPVSPVPPTGPATSPGIKYPAPATVTLAATAPSAGGLSLADKLAKARGGMGSTPEVPEVSKAEHKNALAGAIAKNQFKRTESKDLSTPNGLPLSPPAAQKSEADQRWEELEKSFKRPLKLDEMDFTDLGTKKHKNNLLQVFSVGE